MNTMFTTSGPPFHYDYVNRADSAITPSTVHIHNSLASRFFQKYLLQRAMSVFTWNLPEHWDKDFFLYGLYCWGFVCILETDKFGVIPQNCGISGYNVYYRPNKVLVSNPLFGRGPISLQIGTQCTLFHLNPNFTGILDIVGYYADLLALCSETTSINLLNSKLSYVFTAEGRGVAESFKKMYDKVASGEPAVVIDKDLLTLDGSPLWSSFSQNVGQNFIAPDILIAMSKINNMFDTLIGIPNANLDKKERMVTDEVTANNEETFSLASGWLESLKKTCNQTNEMFGINMSVNWRFPPGSDNSVNRVFVDSSTVSLQPKSF